MLINKNIFLKISNNLIKKNDLKLFKNYFNIEKLF